ncbi:MAG: hypothetical protein EA357_06830, partial [Micavibrio sp.]
PPPPQDWPAQAQNNFLSCFPRSLFLSICMSVFPGGAKNLLCVKKRSFALRLRMTGRKEKRREANQIAERLTASLRATLRERGNPESRSGSPRRLSRLAMTIDDDEIDKVFCVSTGKEKGRSFLRPFKFEPSNRIKYGLDTKVS